MEKLKMHSPNLIEGNISKLAELFPGCVTESTDENGKLKKAIDFDLLRQDLSGAIVEGPQERYHLNWPGKREALLTANAPIARTLRPCREESVDFDTTKNLFIEGDNLDALKLLQETYLGKVKMIYIDPPYNTGKDFIYKDNFAENTEEYLKKSNQKDEEGNRLVANTDSNGRFHSDWLSMIYPRLKLARNLLKDDGVIFISIDDNEVHNLRKMCDEIFGSENFCGAFIWEKKKKPSFLKKSMGTVTDYIISYAKNYSDSPEFTVGEVEHGKKYPFNNAGNGIATLKFPAHSVKFNCDDGAIEAQDMSEGNIITELIDDIIVENGTNCHSFRLRGEWRYGQDKLNEFVTNNEEIIISKIPFRPNYINKKGGAKKIANLLSRRINNIPTNEDASSEIVDLFGATVMDYPKPTGLIKYLVEAVNKGNDIILDFFAGSSTTAHAVMQLNAEDGGNRKFIMVQLSEKCDEKLEAYKAGYSTIAEISKERIRRAGKKITTEYTENAEKKKEDLFDSSSVSSVDPKLDIGFRVLKIDSSNMAAVYYTPDAVEQKSLFLSMDNIKPDRTAEDLLFQVLLDWGVDLSLSVTKEIIAGKEVFFVDGNALAACFVKNGGITENFVKELAKRKPLRVVFRDAGFKDDSVKINVEQIFKLISPHTEVKTI